jgi:hypothetical protein
MGEERVRGGESVSADTAIMAAIDRSSLQARLVIANVSCDGQWISIPEAKAPMLHDYR